MEGISRASAVATGGRGSGLVDNLITGCTFANGVLIGPRESRFSGDSLDFLGGTAASVFSGLSCMASTSAPSRSSRSPLKCGRFLSLEALTEPDPDLRTGTGGGAMGGRADTSMMGRVGLIFTLAGTFTSEGGSLELATVSGTDRGWTGSRVASIRLSAELNVASVLDQTVESASATGHDSRFSKYRSNVRPILWTGVPGRLYLRQFAAMSLISRANCCRSEYMPLSSFALAVDKSMGWVITDK